MGKRVKVLFLILFATLAFIVYIFYLKDWIKPAPVDLGPLVNTTFFTDKLGEQHEIVMKNILAQTRGFEPLNEHNECRTINSDKGYERITIYDESSNSLSISYYFRIYADTDTPVETISSVEIKIISNNWNSLFENSGHENLFDLYFSDINSILKYKLYYTQQHGVIRPIFNMVSQKGKEGKMKYLISPLCNCKSEYGTVINNDFATVDMCFTWDNYSIIVYEMTYNYSKNFSSPIALSDLLILLQQTESEYSKEP